MMEQQWLSIDYIGLVDLQDVLIWNGYLAIVKSSHVKLSNNLDELV